MDKNYIIETKNLTKQYGSQKSVADLNIHVQRGRIYGLLVILSILVDTFSSRISLTMPPSPKPHNTACVLS